MKFRESNGLGHSGRPPRLPTPPTHRGDWKGSGAEVGLWCRGVVWFFEEEEGKRELLREGEEWI